MSVPPDQLKQLMSGGPQPGPGGMPGPAGAPMQTPQNAEGDKAHGAAIVETGMQLLMSALPLLGATSEEAKVLFECLGKLGKTFGKSNAGELVPAQLQMLRKGTSPSPEMMAMQQGAAQQKPPGMPGM